MKNDFRRSFQQDDQLARNVEYMASSNADDAGVRAQLVEHFPPGFDSVFDDAFYASAAAAGQPDEAAEAPKVYDLMTNGPAPRECGWSAAKHELSATHRSSAAHAARTTGAPPIHCNIVHTVSLGVGAGP